MAKIVKSSTKIKINDDIEVEVLEINCEDNTNDIEFEIEVGQWSATEFKEANAPRTVCRLQTRVKEKEKYKAPLIVIDYVIQALNALYQAQEKDDKDY